jgi:hypothetical protein
VEPLGNRTTLIVALTLVFAMFSAGFVLTKIGEGYRPVNCSIHYPSVTCTPQT